MTSLKLIKSKLEEIITIFAYQSTPNYGQNNQQILSYSITGLNSIRKVISILSTLHLFDPITQYLSNTIIFTTSNNALTIQGVEGSTINSQLNNLRELINNLDQALSSIIIEEDPNSINIKIPDLINDFSKLSEIAKEIHFAISQPLLLSDLHCETKIAGVENGSITINVDLTSIEATVSVIAGATGFIIKMINSAIIIRKNKLEGDKLREQIRELKIKNDKIDLLQIEEAQTLLENETVQTEANKIEEEYFTKDDNGDSNENSERIKNAIETLSDLLSKGIIITPSIKASEETVKKFPSVSEQLLLESKTKQLNGPTDNI